MKTPIRIRIDTVIQEIIGMYAEDVESSFEQRVEALKKLDRLLDQLGATCRAAKDKDQPFGERCGKPVFDIVLLASVCKECAEYMEKARRDPNTLGSILAEELKNRGSGENA